MTENSSPLTPAQERRVTALRLALELAPSGADVWGYVDFILRGGRPTADANDVILTDLGQKKIHVIKAIRSIVADFGLVEAKDLVDRVEAGAPQVVISGASPDEVAAAKRLLLDAGATVTVRDSLPTH